MKARGLLKPGAVRRVAIVGPGLDFADKDVGFDVYPQQTLQPFAVLDSLERLRSGALARRSGDRAPRHQPADHRSRHAGSSPGRKNIGYTLNLPLPKSTPWLPEVRTYWQTFGDRIGAPARRRRRRRLPRWPSCGPSVRRPSVVQRMSVLDVNIVTDRLEGSRSIS